MDKMISPRGKNPFHLPTNPPPSLSTSPPKTMAPSPTLNLPTPHPKTLPPTKPKPSATTSAAANATTPPPPLPRRRAFLSLASSAAIFPAAVAAPARAGTDEEYVKETEEVINTVRTTINMDKTDPNVAAAVAELREKSNYWVAKYRREKALLGRVSFRDIYSALNAVSGHYVSFGPTTPIPTKRKVRILEEIDTAEKALSRGR